MPQITLTNEQKAQLVGWLNWEKDHLLSIVSMSKQIILPKVSGTLELAKNDLDFLVRLRNNLRNTDLTIDFNVQDIEILSDVAGQNPYANRREFWTGIETVTQKALT